MQRNFRSVDPVLRMNCQEPGAMKIAWGMYETLGFVRAPDLDLMLGDLPVLGLRLPL